jgi:hypothetical protein
VQELTYDQKRYRKLIAEDPDYNRKNNAGRWEKLRADPVAYAARQESVRRHKLKTKYGITLEDFDRMFEEQNGICAICPRQIQRSGYGTHIDHDHTTKVVRSLLCLQCNTALGKMNEDERIILSMLAYVRKHKTN